MILPGRPCAICTHPERSALEALILTPGTSDATVARRAGIGHSTVRRHARRHMQGVLYAVQRAHITEEIAHQGTLTDQVRGLILEAIDTLQDAKLKEVACNCILCRRPGFSPHVVTVPNVAGRVQAIDTCRKLLETLGKVTGEITTPSVEAFLNEIGARSRAEVMQGQRLLKSSSDVTHEAAFEQALGVLDLMLKVHPDWHGKAAAFVAARASYAEVVEDAETQAGL